MKVLITGGAGFVGSHLIEHILKNTDWVIYTIDRLDTSGNLNRLVDMDCWEAEKHRVKFIFHDLKAEINDQLGNILLFNRFKGIDQFDYIIHLAAGTHVDRSIEDPMSFVYDNVVATGNILEFARYGLKDGGRFLYFSTDEVFGTAPEGVAYKEWDRYNSGNPYSAAKAGGEELALAWSNTFGIPVIITHCMNIFGERQHPEKFVPLCIKKILEDETITIHSNPDKTKSGTRHYLHVRNVCAAILFLLEKGLCVKAGEEVGKYNIVGDEEVSNLDMAQMIAYILGRELKYEMVDFHSSRPGHDLRYALDGSLLKSTGFVPPVNFKDSLERTIKWTIANKDKWLL